MLGLNKKAIKSYFRIHIVINKLTLILGKSLNSTREGA